MKFWKTVTVSFLFILSTGLASHAREIDCNGAYCGEIDESELAQQERLNAYLDFPPQAIFVLPTETTPGIAEEIRTETLKVTRLGIFKHVLSFETTTGKQITVPYLSEDTAKLARGSLSNHMSIDLSSCEHDETLSEGGFYDERNACVRTSTIKKRSYQCGLTDRTPLLTSYDPVDYSKEGLSLERFVGVEREVIGRRCVVGR